MGSAVFLQNVVVWVYPAFAVGEREVGGSEVGAVVYEYTVVREELHVHGGDANV